MSKRLIKTTQAYQNLIAHHLEILKSLQYESGLFAASSKSVDTGYDKSWLRDNFYECLAFEVVGDWPSVEKTYTALIKIFLKHEAKIDHAIAHKPVHKYEYIHARFHHDTFDEFWEEWGNKQNDSIGAILFRIGELENHHKINLLKTEDDIRIINKLVEYLASIEYWHDSDHGIWEFDEEIHASSIGACVAGLLSINHLECVQVPQYLIENGKTALEELLPRESKKNFVDLAQLSLIWPYRVASAKQRKEILENVEYHLVKEHGVIRFKNDWYYNKNTDGYSEDAEWCFGLCWLAIIYTKLGDKEKAQTYIDKMLNIVTPDGVPELYYSNSDKPNENVPLGWAESLFVIALHDLMDRFLTNRHNSTRMMRRKKISAPI